MASPDASLQSLFTRQGNPLHCFVPVCGERGQRGDNATACLLEVYLVLAPLPVTSLTPHMPPASLAVALVVVPRVGGMVYILGPCRPFKWLLLRDWKFLPPPQTPLVFTDRSYEALSSSAGILGCVVWPEAGTTRSPGISPDFYPPYMNVVPPTLLATATTTLLPPHLVLSASAPHLPHPTCLDEYDSFKSLVVRLYTVWFSGSSECFLF